MDAAMEAVERFGLARFTMDDVARNAGMARQTVYRYFTNRDALIQAVIHREEDLLLTGLRAGFTSAESLVSAVDTGAQLVLAALRAHPVLQMLLEREPDQLLPFLTTQATTTVRRAAAELAAGLAAFRPEAERALVDAAADLFVRAMISHVLTPSERPDARIAAEIAVLIDRSLS